MFLTKGGVTIEIASPIDIKRYKALGFLEPKIDYPGPEMVVDGKKLETPPTEPPAQQPVKPPAAKGSARKADKKAVNDEP